MTNLNDNLTIANEAQRAFRAGQPVKLGDLARTLARVSNDIAAERAADRRAREAQAQAAAEAEHGVFVVCDDGSLSRIGDVSDFDVDMNGNDIVEVEYEYGGRRWYKLEEVVVK